MVLKCLLLRWSLAENLLQALLILRNYIASERGSTEADYLCMFICTYFAFCRLFLGCSFTHDILCSLSSCPRRMVPLEIFFDILSEMPIQWPSPSRIYSLNHNTFAIQFLLWSRTDPPALLKCLIPPRIPSADILALSLVELPCNLIGYYSYQRLLLR
jgi:hypothetical protein